MLILQIIFWNPHIEGYFHNFRSLAHLYQKLTKGLVLPPLRLASIKKPIQNKVKHNTYNFTMEQK